MKKETAFIAVLAVALLVVGLQTMQLFGVMDTVKKNEFSAASTQVQAGSGNSETGEPYDQMMARMHPDQSGSSVPQSVGGC